MQNAIKLKYISLAAFLLFALGMAVPAFAEVSDEMSPAESTGENAMEVEENTDEEQVSETDEEESSESESEEEAEEKTQEVDDDSKVTPRKAICDEDQKKLGQKVRCEVYDRTNDLKQNRSELKDKWKEFGKTADRSELHSQLQELMKMLIALLQQQMQVQNNN